MAEILTLEFLKTIWGDQEGVAELTLIGPRGIQSWPYTYPSELPALIEHGEQENGKVNVYFGVCLRKAKWKKGSRGTAAMAISSTCVWVDIDFKEIAREEALALVKAFPLRPSIIALSGGGVHCYWLLREPATESELRRVKGVNQKLVALLRGDPQAVDLARVLRVVGTQNVKYDPPKNCTVSYWHPEKRYILDDFDVFPDPEKQKEETPAGERHTPLLDLPTETKEKVEGLLTEIWIEGYRHRLSLYVAGMLAHAGIKKEDALEVVKAASDAVGGDTVKRLKNVEDTYRNFEGAKKVGGAGLLEKMVKVEFPALLNERAEKVYKEILACVRKLKPKGQHLTFKVTQVVKFDSRPAIWRAFIRMSDGDLINVDAETPEFVQFKAFRVHAYEQSNRILTAKQAQWDEMLATAPHEIQAAPEEASPEGAMNVALEEFVGERREGADLGVLKSAPGVDDEGIYFRTDAFRLFLKDKGVKPEGTGLHRFLRHRNWENGTKRLGGKVVRVWKKAISGNGQTSPQKEFFQDGVTKASNT